MLDIPAVTIRAWEHRYGVVSPERSETGYRLFSKDDIDDLKWLKHQVEERGMNISQAVRMLEQKREKQKQEQADIAEETEAESASEVTERMVERLYNMLAEYRTEEAKTIVDLGFSMFGYDSMIQDVLLPVLVRIGDAWEQGDITVFQEHYSTQFLMQRCLSFFHIFPTDTSIPKVLSLCPSGEQHQVGLLMFSLFLRKRGIDVLYLGADTPYEGIDKLIESQNIRFVCISATLSQNLKQALRFVEGLSSRFKHMQFALGGAAFHQSIEQYPAWILSHDSNQWNRWYEDVYLKNL